MRFKHYDSLRVFSHVARHGSFSAAADELNLTKGAISHQIRVLESSLGFPLFHRQPRGVALTSKGETLLSASSLAFSDLDNVISDLRRAETTQLTLGTTTYFASRWLSPKLMDFMQHNPEVRLRLQPMIDLSDLDGEGIDLAVRWGKGDWKDLKSELLFVCPAWPCGNETALRQVEELGLEAAFKQFTLLHDKQHSSVWKQWFSAAGLHYTDKEDMLIIRDPNVRVEAVADRQGVALNDALVERELDAGRLYRLSDIELPDYGYYLVHSSKVASNPAAKAFSQWVTSVT